MAGIAEDFAKRPTSQKVAIFAAIAVLAGGAYFQFIYRKQGRELETAQSDKQSLIQRNRKLDDDMKAYEELRKQSDEIEKQIKENAKALPTSAELPAFFDMLNRKVGEAGVEVKAWNYRKEVVVETFMKAPLDVEITGTFYQIKRFFASLEQRDLGPKINADGTPKVEERDRIITIENLEITDPKVKNREIVLNVKFTASTFRQEEVKPDAPAGKAGAPAAGGGTGPVQKAGAKATEALQKDKTGDGLKAAGETAPPAPGAAGSAKAPTTPGGGK